MGALAEAGVTPGRREPPAGPGRQARALGRRLRVGLHRQPAEPQGQAGAAALPPRPLGRHRLGAARARQARHSRDRGPGRGQHRRRGGQGRSRARRPRRLHRALPGPGRRPDDDAARSARTRRPRGPHFARLAELAAEQRAGRLSMGTSQDWPVAVEEGATIIRLGTALRFRVNRR